MVLEGRNLLSNVYLSSLGKHLNKSIHCCKVLKATLWISCSLLIEINGITSLISFIGVKDSSTDDDDQEFISDSAVEAIDIMLKRFVEVLEAASGDNVGYNVVIGLFIVGDWK
jgi:hypothetical protein